jgi:hypothetical protein
MDTIFKFLVTAIAEFDEPEVFRFVDALRQLFDRRVRQAQLFQAFQASDGFRDAPDLAAAFTRIEPMRRGDFILRKPAARMNPSGDRCYICQVFYRGNRTWRFISTFS